MNATMTTPLVQIKPCPFCNGEPTLHTESTFNGPWYMVRCTGECKANTRVCNSRDEAVTAWNTRTAEALAGREALTDDLILEIRDGLLPSQGESFDTLAFGRACFMAAVESNIVPQHCMRCKCFIAGRTHCQNCGDAATPSRAGGAEVGEDMVERACASFYVDDGWKNNDNRARDFMRTALEAALHGAGARGGSGG